MGLSPQATAGMAAANSAAHTYVMRRSETKRDMSTPPGAWNWTRTLCFRRFAQSRNRGLLTDDSVSQAVTPAPYFARRYARYGFGSIVAPVARRNVSCG